VKSYSWIRRARVGVRYDRWGALIRWSLHDIVEAVEGQDAGAAEGPDDGEDVGSVNGATVV